MHRQSTATRVKRKRALGASGSARGAGSPHGRGRAGAANLAGRPTRGARPAPPPAAGVGSGARARSEKRQWTEAADGRARRRKQGAAGPRARAARGVPARGVHRTATHARGVPRARRLGRGTTRTRGGGGGSLHRAERKEGQTANESTMIHITHRLRVLLGCGGESRQTTRPLRARARVSRASPIAMRARVGSLRAQR